MTTNRYDANCTFGRWADGGPTPRFLILGENTARLMGWD
jgi:hypothetical protein